MGVRGEVPPEFPVSKEDAIDGFSDVHTYVSDQKSSQRVGTMVGDKREIKVEALGIKAKQGRRPAAGVNVTDEGIVGLEVIPTAAHLALEIATAPIEQLVQAPGQVQADVAKLRKRGFTHRSDLVQEDQATRQQRPRKNTEETRRGLNESDVPWDAK